MTNFVVDQGFPNSFTKSPPFQKFEKKSPPLPPPPISLYSNFPLEGALFSQKCCVKNVINSVSNRLTLE